MRVLFDNGVPWAIADALPEHEVTFTRSAGWHELKNGELIRRAEAEGFDILLTTDKNIPYQQNLTGRRLALLILSHPQWPDVCFNLDRIALAVDQAIPGSYVEIKTRS